MCVCAFSFSSGLSIIACLRWIFPRVRAVAIIATIIIRCLPRVQRVQYRRIGRPRSRGERRRCSRTRRRRRRRRPDKRRLGRHQWGGPLTSLRTGQRKQVWVRARRRGRSRSHTSTCGTCKIGAVLGLVVPTTHEWGERGRGWTRRVSSGLRLRLGRRTGYPAFSYYTHMRYIHSEQLAC